MIFGVSSRGVFVTNGIEVLSFEEIRTGLESPSVLQIHRSDAMSCSPFDAERCDSIGDKWAELQVTKQLQEMKDGSSKAECVLIPAAYRAGITIFARKGSPAAQALRQAPELPLR